MLENWLSSTAVREKFAAENPAAAGSFFEKLHFLNAPTTKLKKKSVALIGIRSREADAIREALYPLAASCKAGMVTDVGNLRKNDPEVLIPVLRELMAGEIVPVLLGGQDSMAVAPFFAYHESKNSVNWVTVDEKPRFGAQTDEHFYNRVLQPRHKALFHWAWLGCQQHYCTADVLKIVEKNSFELLRLGKCRQEMEETEPIIRDADLFTFHLSALKMSDAPAVVDASPSGFFCEEACQLCRYAGISDKLSMFGIFGYENNLDRHHQTAQVVAQMIWYFLEGFSQRKNDFPASLDGMVEYIVEIPGLNYAISFWKSTRSGRWWMQVPVETKRKHQRHRLVPCSFQDYQLAVHDELPERLIHALSRF